MVSAYNHIKNADIMIYIVNKISELRERISVHESWENNNITESELPLKGYNMHSKYGECEQEGGVINKRHVSVEKICESVKFWCTVDLLGGF